MEKFLTFQDNERSFSSPRSMLSRDTRLPLDTWTLSGSQGNVFAIHFLCSIHHRHLIKEFFTMRHQLLQVHFQCMSVQGHLKEEVKNELEAQFQCRHLQEGRRPWMPFCQWIFHRVLCLDSTDSRYRNFNLMNSPHLQRFHVGRKDSKTR